MQCKDGFGVQIERFILSLVDNYYQVIKVPSAYSLSEVQEKEIAAVIDAGYYTNKSEVVRDALRTFFETKPQLRIAACVEMYKKGIFTLSKCAEIAGLSIEEFKDILMHRGIKVSPPDETKADVAKGVERLRKRRKNT